MFFLYQDLSQDKGMVHFLERERYYRKSALFNVEFALDSKLKEPKYFDPLFILINKYYPGYYFNIKDDAGHLTKYKWEDIPLYNKCELYYKWNSDAFELLSDLVIPIYIMEGGSIFTKYLDGGIGLFIKSDPVNSSFVILSFHSTLLLNTIKFISQEKDIIEDQTYSSKLNRRSMQLLIKEVENYFNWRITNSWSDEIDKRYLGKYGIKKDAILDNLPS